MDREILLIADCKVYGCSLFLVGHLSDGGTTVLRPGRPDCFKPAKTLDFG